MLIHRDTKKPVEVGELVRDFRNEDWLTVSWREPSRPGAAAKVTVVRNGSLPTASNMREFYASVFGLTWQDP